MDDSNRVEIEPYKLPQESEDHFFREGKVEINQLLWKLLPAGCTIGRAEEIAVQIYVTVAEEWGKQ